eukprot:s1442_g11.t2
MAIKLAGPGKPTKILGKMYEISPVAFPWRPPTAVFAAVVVAGTALATLGCFVLRNPGMDMFNFQWISRVLERKWSLSPPVDADTRALKLAETEDSDSTLLLSAAFAAAARRTAWSMASATWATEAPVPACATLDRDLTSTQPCMIDLGLDPEDDVGLCSWLVGRRSTAQYRPRRIQRTPAKRLGKGSFGTVHKASAKSTGAIRAVKYIALERMKEKINVLKKEIEIMKDGSFGIRIAQCVLAVDHPNIIMLYEIFEDPKHVLLVMELCTGGTLLNRVRMYGRLCEEQTAIAMQQILRAVYYLHSTARV